MNKKDVFNARASLSVGDQSYTYYRLDTLQEAGLTRLEKLPFSIRVMLEAVLRACGGSEVTAEDVKALAAWQSVSEQRPVLAFFPGRVLMQDFSGIPLLNDLAGDARCVEKNGRRSAKNQPTHSGRPGGGSFAASRFLRHARFSPGAIRSWNLNVILNGISFCAGANKLLKISV